jgi:ABC-type spermidine/putrescine transport system permease subunit II
MVKVPNLGPQVRALSTLFILATIIIVLLSEYITRKRTS